MLTFADTSHFIAYFDTADHNHVAAKAVWHLVEVEAVSLVTTNYTIAETIAVLQRRLGMAAVREFVAVVVPLVDVAWIDSPLHDAAVEALLAADNRSLSLVDQIAFAYCRREGITEVFAFDRHFTDQGFKQVG